MQRKASWRRRLFMTLMVFFVLSFAAMIFLKQYITPTVRDDVAKKLYTVGDRNYAIALSEGKKIVKFGRLPLGIYSGGMAFDNIEDANHYLAKNEKLKEGWRVYLVSGDFDLDTLEVNGQRYTNKSLLVLISVDALGSALGLSYSDFDQKPNSGWRSLADEQKYEEAAKLIDSYVQSHTELPENQVRNLHFHAGQMYAYAGEDEKSKARFQQSMLPHELEDSPLRWNSYVAATIAFLNKDLETLKSCREEIATGPKMGDVVPNLDVVDSLLEHFSDTYQTAYDHHRGISRR